MATVSYTPTEWTEEVAITAARLNNIEEGIEDLVTQGNAQETEISAIDTTVDKHEALLYESGTNHQVLTQTSSGVPEWVNPEVVSLNASDIDFDNTSSSLTATNVQDAVEQVNTLVAQNAGNLTQLRTDALTTQTTSTTYTSDFENYSSNTNNAPHFWKVGKVVTMTGIAKPTAQIASGDSATMFTIPTGFRPITDIRQLCQGSNSHIWMIQLTASTGAVVFGRLRNGADATATSGAAEWLPFSVTYICQ